MPCYQELRTTEETWRVHCRCFGGAYSGDFSLVKGKPKLKPPLQCLIIMGISSWTMIFGAFAAGLGQGLRGLPWWDSPMLLGSGTTGDPWLGAVTAHPATLRGHKSLGNAPRKLLQRLSNGCHCCIVLHKTFGKKVIN